MSLTEDGDVPPSSFTADLICPQAQLLFHLLDEIAPCPLFWCSIEVGSEYGGFS